MLKKKVKEKITTYSDVALIELFDHNVFFSPNRKSAFSITRPDYLGTQFMPNAIFNFSITDKDRWEMTKTTEIVVREVYNSKGEGVPFLESITRNGAKIQLVYDDITGLISDSGKHHLLNFPRTKIGNRENAGCYVHSFSVEDQFWVSRLGYDEKGIFNYVGYASCLNTHPLFGEYLLIAYGDGGIAELIILNEWLNHIKQSQIPKMNVVRFADDGVHRGGDVKTWFNHLVKEFERTPNPLKNPNLIVEERL